MYAVHRTEPFDKEAAKLLSHEELNALNRFEQEHLCFNPYVGRHLRYPFLREKRLGSKRVYFLIYESIRAVLLVTVSDKKEQQVTIDQIISQLSQYQTRIQAILRQRA